MKFSSFTVVTTQNIILGVTLTPSVTLTRGVRVHVPPTQPNLGCNLGLECNPGLQNSIIPGRIKNGRVFRLNYLNLIQYLITHRTN